MTFDLFDSLDPSDTSCAMEPIAEGAFLLRGFARPAMETLLAGIDTVIAAAPLRQLVTPGGLTMSVAMSNCGELGWVSDRRGYRYESVDPITGKPWPPMPRDFRRFAREAADRAGFPGFEPDACLVNRYEPGNKLSMHQDRDEARLVAPIISVSLGPPAVFLFGGSKRQDKALRLSLRHGDVVVWGGPSRLRFHGVLPLAEGEHPLLGRRRINLTFRQAG